MDEYRHADGTLCPHPQDTQEHRDCARALGCTGRAWKITRPGGLATGGMIIPKPASGPVSSGLMQVMDSVPVNLDRGDYVIPSAIAARMALHYMWGSVVQRPVSLVNLGTN